MKTLIDNFVSCVVFVIIIFGIASFSLVGMQIMTARRIHTSVINQIQSSYYKVDVGCENTKSACTADGATERESSLNGQLHKKYPDWYITKQTVKAVNDRKDEVVTLHYKVVLPLFGVTKEGEIDGYAR